jgi:hypothetical protein
MKTAVDQLIEKMSLEDVCKYSNELAEAKEMEEEQIVEEKIELIKSIGNQGENAPLYGILKTTLLELYKQYNEIRTRCLN